MRTAPRQGAGGWQPVVRTYAGLLGLLLGSAHGLIANAGADSTDQAGTARLDLPVSEIVAPYAPYSDFCRRHPVQCDLTGANVVAHGPALREMLNLVNAAVNREIRFVLDRTEYDREEYWALPENGRGDCEDKALEKRRRLAERGLPRGAMRMALVFHRDWLSSHGVLTIETSRGTYVLDSRTDDVRRWDQVPYNFEARERPDGSWERFDQSHWRYD